MGVSLGTGVLLYISGELICKALACFMTGRMGRVDDLIFGIFYFIPRFGIRFTLLRTPQR
jgi:hypothetical protein